MAAAEPVHELGFEASELGVGYESIVAVIEESRAFLERNDIGERGQSTGDGMRSTNWLSLSSRFVLHMPPYQASPLKVKGLVVLEILSNPGKAEDAVMPAESE